MVPIISIGSNDNNNNNQQQTKKTGRQYQDVNHLLGFTLPPRIINTQTSIPRRSTRSRQSNPLYSRQRFVHHFRFVLKPDKDYTSHFVDPDIHFEWQDILQVIVERDQKGEIPTCAICLSIPSAARMSKCGHVTCFACMLHYLELADGTKFRKCPICFDPIYEKDLKPVRWHDPIASTSLAILPTSHSHFPTNPNAVSDDFTPPSSLTNPSPFSTSTAEVKPSPALEKIKMRLIRRPQFTTLALPRSSTFPSDAVPPLQAPWDFTPNASTYAKFMLGSPEYIKSELEENLRELERELISLGGWAQTGVTDDELGVTFSKAAIKKVKEQIEKASELKTTAVMMARKAALKQLQFVEQLKGMSLGSELLPLETSSSEVEEEIPSDFLGTRLNATSTSSILSSSALPFSPNSLPSTPTTPSSNHRSRAQRRNINPPSVPSGIDSAYLFYQAASGQNIFLQPLDIRVLKSHYGSYESLPDTIEVIIEGSDEGSMNEDLRKRCKWLSHLPTAVDIVFIEADLTHVVSRSSLEPFSIALKQRRTKRRDKGRKDDRAKLKSELRELEERPRFEGSTYTVGGGDGGQSWQIPLTSSKLAESLMENHAFPPPRSLNNNYTSSSSNQNETSYGSPPKPEESSSSSTIWGTPNRSFASALHNPSTSSSRQNQSQYHYEEDEYDSRWQDFEDNYAGFSNGGGNGKRGGGGSASGSNSNAGKGNGGDVTVGGGGGGGKKKKKKFVLNLTMAGRGTA